MNRRALFTAAVAVALTMGCSSPSDTSTEDTTQSASEALTSICDSPNDDNADCDKGGPRAYTMRAFTLTSLNGATVTGVNGFGQTITANFVSTTNFRLANLARFAPGDPVFPLLVTYNAAVTGQDGILTAIGNLAGHGGQARIALYRGTTNIRAFRPVP